jgi:hypothetical protein
MGVNANAMMHMCLADALQADYDMQLRKMALTAERKGAVLQKLLDVTSRHLLLLMLRGQECSRLGWLSEELHAAHAQLEGHVDRVRARVNRCVINPRSRMLHCVCVCGPTLHVLPGQRHTPAFFFLWNFQHGASAITRKCTFGGQLKQL